MTVQSVPPSAGQRRGDAIPMDTLLLTMVSPAAQLVPGRWLLCGATRVPFSSSSSPALTCSRSHASRVMDSWGMGRGRLKREGVSGLCSMAETNTTL